MAQKPTKSNKISVSSDWEGTLDSMISGGAADAQAQKGTLGDGLVDTLVSSIPFLITGRDPKLQNTTKTPEPQKVSVPTTPAVDVPIVGVDDPAGKAEKEGAKSGNFFKSLLKVIGLGS